MTTQPTSTTIRIKLGFFKDFPTVAGLLRDSGARREGARLFVIDSDMTAAQVAALTRLLRYHDRDGNKPVTVEIDPPLPVGHYGDQFGELTEWWGTVDDWR